MADKELIYKDDARAAVLRTEPRAAYCIDRVKAVDAVEVVRCKDCGYYCPETNDRPICVSWGSWCDPDGWCYQGERRCEDAVD